MGTPANLITGITGFAGPWLARLLLEAGERVAGLAVGATTEATLPDGIEMFVADIRDRDRIEEIVAAVDPERVYHLAALSHVGDSWGRRKEALEVNVVGTGLLFEAMANAAPEARVMLVSSGQIYGAVTADEMPIDERRPVRPVSPYAASKACCEVLARQAVDAGDVAVTIARPFNFAGPGQHPSFVCSDFARQIAWSEAGRREPVIRVGNLEARRDFTDVRDMVRGFDAVARHGRPGRAYNLASGRATRIQDILDALVELAQVPIRIEADPERMRPADVPVFLGDPGRAREELGWEATRPLRDTVSDTLEFWRRRARETDG